MTMMADNDKQHPFFLHLPEVIIYSILTCVAPPTDRASVLCHRIAPLDSAHRSAVESGWDILWSTIHDEEYGNVGGSSAAGTARLYNAGDCGGGGGSSSAKANPTALRMSKRLRRTPKSQVEAAHALLLDNTRIGHFALSEMAHSSRTSLTLARLRWIFREYGPVLRVNQQADIGGTFLIECCRARHVEEKVVLRCVRELVEKHGALPDVSSAPLMQVSNRSPKDDLGLTPLCIAAARGMPSVVKYLLKIGASPEMEGTGRFRLYSNSRMSVFGTYSPLGFATAMREKEVEQGLDRDGLRSLDQCIRVLQKAQR